jgi:hypothetical protein
MRIRSALFCAAFAAVDRFDLVLDLELASRLPAVLDKQVNP